MSSRAIDAHPPDESVARELVGSLAILGAVIAIALVGLALDGNWLKLARVTSAALAYGGVLWAALGAASRLHAPGASLPASPFLAAGASAGLVSGLVRSEWEARFVAASAASAAILFGGFHWLALRSWRRVLRRIGG
jgi:hypothetical protein